MKKFNYVIKDEAGIHARPAGMLVNEAKKYKSHITLFINGTPAEATKIMDMMKMEVKYGQMVAVEITGEDEEVAYEGIKAFFEENL